MSYDIATASYARSCCRSLWVRWWWSLRCTGTCSSYRSTIQHDAGCYHDRRRSHASSRARPLVSDRRRSRTMPGAMPSADHRPHAVDVPASQSCLRRGARPRLQQFALGLATSASSPVFGHVRWCWTTCRMECRLWKYRSSACWTTAASRFSTKTVDARRSWRSPAGLDWSPGTVHGEHQGHAQEVRLTEEVQR